MTTAAEMVTMKMVQHEADGRRQAARNDVLRAVATAANLADALPEAVQVALDEVCGLTGWPVGHLYLVAGDEGTELLPTSVWHLDDPEHYRAFHRLSHLSWFTSGVGLPGQVLEGRRPVWIQDITEWAAFRRAAVAAELGITSALGVPVMTGREMVAVLEFFSVDTTPPDDDLFELLVEVGRQLGRGPSGPWRPRSCGPARSAPAGSWRRRATLS